MNKEWSIWLKRNNPWLFLCLYILLHFTFLYHHLFIVLKTGLATLMTILANTGMERRIQPKLRALTYVVGGVSICLLDEWMVPELAECVRMRYLIPLSALALVALMYRKSLATVWNLFMGMTVIFLSIYLLYPWTERIDFTFETPPSNPLYDSLHSSLGKKAPITLVLADGYPSAEILEGRLGTAMSLDSQLGDYSHSRLLSRYASTPLSVANMLFGAVFERDDLEFGIRGRQTEIDLIRKAMDGSTMKAALEGRRTLWASLLFDEEYSRLLDLPFWKRGRFRSLFGKTFLWHFDDRRRLNVNIERYNGRILSDYGNSLDNGGNNGLFVFLHLLTYHRWGKTTGEEVAYADSLILEAVRLTPKNRKLIIFSDHGHRAPGMNAEEMRSGILMTSPDP